MKGEELPDEKMLAVVDIGGGARIGLRKTELKKPENVVKVKPFEKEVLSRWRVGTLHKSKKKGSKEREFEPLYPGEQLEERLEIVVRLPDRNLRQALAGRAARSGSWCRRLRVQGAPDEDLIRTRRREVKADWPRAAEGQPRDHLRKKRKQSWRGSRRRGRLRG